LEDVAEELCERLDEPFDCLLDGLVAEFELIKRQFSGLEMKEDEISVSAYIECPGLKQNPEKKFRKGSIELTRYFLPVLSWYLAPKDVVGIRSKTYSYHSCALVGNSSSLSSLLLIRKDIAQEFVRPYDEK